MQRISDYSAYQKLKGWDQKPFMQFTIAERVYYEHYLGLVSLADQIVLEVGFGNGNLLGWAAQKGAKVYGTELQPEAIQKAIQCGVEVLPADLSESVDRLRERVAVFAAIDVLEHITREQTSTLLKQASDMLKTDGLIFFRFPNGQSPLSLKIQYGDDTHISIVAIPMIERMITGLPLTVEYAGGSEFPVHGNHVERLLRKAKWTIRSVVDRMLKTLYGDISLHENAVMVLRKV